MAEKGPADNYSHDRATWAADTKLTAQQYFSPDSAQGEEVFEPEDATGMWAIIGGPNIA
jgi:hypothetical protein